MEEKIANLCALLWVGLLLFPFTACTSAGERATPVPSPQFAAVETATSPVSTVSPTLSTLTATPQQTPFPSLATSPPPVGWAWHQNEEAGYAVPYPQSWRQSGGEFQAPGTNSQLQVGVRALPPGIEWLDWVRDNQQGLLLTSPVAPEQITANATVQGQPATFRLAVPPEEVAWRSGVLFRGLEALPLRWNSPSVVTT